MKSPAPQNLIPIDHTSDNAILPTEMANYHAKEKLDKKRKTGLSEYYIPYSIIHDRPMQPQFFEMWYEEW